MEVKVGENMRINKQDRSGKTKIVLTCTMALLMAACAERPANMTPEEAAEYRGAEEVRVKEMLSETSPRNQNHLPKAVPEFRAKIPRIGPD